MVLCEARGSRGGSMWGHLGHTERDGPSRIDSAAAAFSRVAARHTNLQDKGTVHNIARSL